MAVRHVNAAGKLRQPFVFSTGCSTSNPSEAEVAEALQNAGFEVWNKGWPDFLAVHKETGEVRCYEVKPSRTATVSPEQVAVAKILKAAGIPVSLGIPKTPPKDRYAVRALPEDHRFAPVLNAIHDHKLHTVCVVGSRRYDKTSLLDTLVKALPVKVRLITDGQGGVAKAARSFAIKHNHPFEEHPPEWQKLGKSAAFQNNRTLLKRSDLIVALWDMRSKETADLIDKAVLAKRHLFVFGPDGERREAVENRGTRLASAKA